MAGFPLFCLLPAVLTLGPGTPTPDLVDVGAVAVKILQTWQPALGLNSCHTFSVRGILPDRLLEGVDVRIGQNYLGVPVYGGEAIMHMKGNHVRSFTDKLHRPVTLSTKPTLTPSEGLAIAVHDLAPRGPFVIPPSTELVIARLTPKRQPTLAQDLLVYHIHTELENGTLETAHTDYFIDAHSGAIRKKWSTLHSAASEGLGLSQFNGKVAIQTNSTTTGYELRDLTRGDSGNTVLDLNHGTGDSGGQIFTNANNTWGDGLNYSGGATSSVNGQTAAVDAAFGSQWTWDYYKKIHARNGIDGNGTATSMRVHYSKSYDNAFWSDSCFCMTFGDGSRFKSLEAIDVMGHEMSHGVCAATANLEYSGESGGLNEANSDIHGTMVEFFSRGGSATSIGNTGGTWTMGEQLATSRYPKPLRYMYKPSLDGQSPDAWYDGIADLDVHFSSGPMNRCFYFLSQGASGTTSSDFYTSYLPKGMTGIGNDKAARVWYRAMVSYMTSSSDYAEARKSALSAVQDLYGAGGQEEQAVWNAFHGINVGPAWPQTAPGNTVTASITSPSGDLKIASDTTVQFQGGASDSSPSATLSYSWNFGDGASATGASASHAFVNTGSTDLIRTVTFKASDATGATASVTRAITVTPAPGPTPGGTETILNGGFEDGALHWEGNTERIAAWTPQPAHAGKQAAWLLGSNRPERQTLRQVVVLPAGMTQGSLAFQLHVAVGKTSTQAPDTLSVELISLAGSTTLATYSNLNAAPGYALKTLSVPATQGEVAILLFRASGTGSTQTSFVLDDLSLTAK